MRPLFVDGSQRWPSLCGDSCEVSGRRGAPSRFARGVRVFRLLGVIWAFQGGYHLAGFIFGCVLTSVALPLASSNICIPSVILIYRAEALIAPSWLAGTPYAFSHCLIALCGWAPPARQRGLVQK